MENQRNRFNIPSSEIGGDANIGFDGMVGGKDKINAPWP